MRQLLSGVVLYESEMVTMTSHRLVLTPNPLYSPHPTRSLALDKPP